MNLNNRQRQAVEATTGPIAIIAGPGTGKTKTLTARIAHLLDRGIPADKILALTFTNKAAREMQERIAELIPGKKPHVTTFHGLCYKILTELAGEKPSIITEAERQRIIKGLKKSQTLKGRSLRELSLQISLVKSSINKQHTDIKIATLLQKYQESLSQKNLCDFDDLLVRAYEILKDSPEERPAYEYLLVDEFQDTNDLQYELLKLLNVTDNIFVIGDPLQSIYGFRGGSAEIFDRFLKDWPTCKKITLETNYRSVSEVVTLGCAVFPDRLTLKPHRSEAGMVQCVELLNEYSEANWILETIEQRIGGSTMIRGHEHYAGGQDKQSFRDFAVLYRTHHTAKVLRRLLEESGLPYQVAGEGTPYQRPSATAISASLGYLAGKNDIQPMLGFSQSQLHALLRPIKEGGIDRQVGELATVVAQALGLDAEKYRSELQTFFNSLVRFDDRSLEVYLEHLDSMAEQEFYDPSADAVTLLTIHAAKGLEFEHVFLLGAEEGLLPYARLGQAADIEEERRLFYVAITRARSRLDILHTQKRTGKDAKLSQFIYSLPTAVLPRIVDPALDDQRRRLKKRQAKRSQTALF